ncbi:MAG: GAF domain-containing protein, partial [Ancrocorticia sp.]|nr:GAF domain-containing protein [Ancrocorticia sp.]
MAVLDSRGETLQFVFSGIEPWLADKIGTPPKGHGLLGDIPDDRYLIVNDLKGGDYPPNHPHLHNFLGVPIRIQDRVFGRRYLSDKDGGFTDDDGNNMLLLAQAAAIAVENSRLYAESNTRA